MTSNYQLLTKYSENHPGLSISALRKNKDDLTFVDHRQPLTTETLEFVHEYYVESTTEDTADRPHGVLPDTDAETFLGNIFSYKSG